MGDTVFTCSTVVEEEQMLGDNDMYEQDSMCTVILNPTNITFLPVVSKEEDGQEILVYSVLDDDNIKLEISEDTSPELSQEVQHKRNPQSKPRQGSHICKYCNKVFSQSVNLVTHERIHTGEKPFLCSVCWKPFSQQPNLWKHMRTHTGERPYKCVVCNKGFTQQANLTKHIRIHTGEKPYACSYCGKRFTQQVNLTKHIRLHTGERPFSCSYCEKKFVQQSNLERHERTHTGIRPFQCNVCNESFVQNAHLSKHLRSVHKDNVESFVIGNESYVNGELITADYSEDDPSHPTQLTKKSIPVLYCTKTGKILRRVDQ